MYIYSYIYNIGYISYITCSNLPPSWSWTSASKSEPRWASDQVHAAAKFGARRGTGSDPVNPSSHQSWSFWTVSSDGKRKCVSFDETNHINHETVSNHGYGFFLVLLVWIVGLNRCSTLRSIWDHWSSRSDHWSARDVGEPPWSGLQEVGRSTGMPCLTALPRCGAPKSDGPRWSKREREGGKRWSASGLFSR